MNGKPVTQLAEQILSQAAELEQRREPYVLATVVWRRRPTSGKPGAKALITADGRMQGFIGGACSGPTVARQALRALQKGLPRLICLGPEEEFPAGGGRIVVPNSCASEGAMEVFLEPRLPPPQLALVGGAPLVRCLAAMAEILGHEVRLIDPQGAEPLTADEIRRQLPSADGAFVVVATIGQYDEDALEAALGTAASYVALVASKKRAAAVTESLRRRGVSDEQIARVRSPAGLDLGTITHEEIAVAILAEIVQHKARALAAEARTPAARTPAAAEDAGAQAADPVCGMTVHTATARHRAEHAGRTYYFCCAGCRERFAADPESYRAAS